MIIRAEKRNGRTYIVQRTQQGVVLRINNRTDQIQSIKNVGPTGYYYDDIAEAVPKDAESVCILGIGGGTAARRLREIGYQGKIIGVDSDEFVLELAALYFDLDCVNEVICMDAREFCRFHEYKYDCVVDDVFVNSEQKVKVWAENIVKHGGTLISNNFPQSGVTVRVCT